MPGAAALALISGGSSAMTGIFSSRADSKEVLAAGLVSEAGVGAVAAVAGAVVVAGSVTVGLTFSLVTGIGALAVGGKWRGASQVMVSFMSRIVI